MEASLKRELVIAFAHECGAGRKYQPEILIAMFRAELLPGFPTQFFTERGDERLESALIPTPPQRLTSQHFSMRPSTPG
jgi:hypothetical protein